MQSGRSSKIEVDVTAEVKASIRQYICDNIVMTAVLSELGDDTSLLRRSIIDSTGFLELVTFLEDHFGIQVDDAEMIPANLDALNKLTCFVESKLQQR